MNLRKLLCGLLALCLLLTMAPAALMEEAPVEEVVVELGGEEVAAVEEAPEEIAGEALEADDYGIIGYSADYEPEGTLVLPLVADNGQIDWNSETVLGIGDTLSISVNPAYEIRSYSIKNYRAVEVEATTEEGETTEDPAAKADEDDAIASIDLTGRLKGKAIITVACGLAGTKASNNFVLTINVMDLTKPAAIDVTKVTLDDAGEIDTERPVFSTETIDMSNGAQAFMAYVLPAGTGKEVLWSSSNSKVAVPAVKATYIDEEAEEAPTPAMEEYAAIPGVLNTIIPKGKGTATITVKCGNAKTTFKVKVTDNFAPKSIKLYADPKAEVEVGNLVGLYTVVYPRPVNDAPITFTIDSNKKACFAIVEEDEDGNVAEQPTLLASKEFVGADGTALLYGIAEGTVKVTAKTYNGKKSTLKVKVVDPNKVDSIELFGFYNKEKYEHELYNEELSDLDPTDPVKDAFIVVPVLKNADGDIVPLDGHEVDYASVKWSSSNKKVATVSIFKNYVGYFQDNALVDFDGNPVEFDEVFDVNEQDPVYAGIVELKGEGTTKITAKTRDGKKSFSITLKVVNSHKADSIETFYKTVEVPTDTVVDLDEYFQVYSTETFYGTVTAKPSHSTSKVTVLGDTTLRTNKKGNVTIKVKTSDGKCKSFTLKIVD